MADVKTHSISLRWPLVMKDGSTLEALTMREPLVSDMLEAAEMAGEQASSARNEICLYAQLCDVPLAQLLDMRACDFARLRESYDFLAAGKESPHEKSERPS